MENPQEKLKERLQLFDDTVHFRKTSRVPTESNIWSWAVFDADLGVTLEEAVCDWAIMEQVIRKLQERYGFDTHHMPGNRNNGRLSKALGRSSHNIVGDKVYVLGGCVIEDDEFEDFFRDPITYGWTKIGPRYYEGMTVAQVYEAIAAQKAGNDYLTRITDVLNKEYGSTLIAKNYALPPMETLFSLRGLKKVGIDMRRRPEVYREYNEIMEAGQLAAADQALGEERGNYVADILTCFMAHSILNRKQFETIYFPVTKKVYDKCAEKGGVIFNFWEAECIRFADYFADYPKGIMIIHPEIEDVRDVRRAFPNACIQGGMPLRLLSSGTPQECVEYVKKLVDDMGEGYIFSTDKMISYRNDCKRENLEAVMDYLRR